MRGTVECLDKVKYYVDLLQTAAGVYLPYPTVHFNLRGTTAGRAWPRKNVIEFNPILLDENPEVFVQQTVGHEVAHLAAWIKHPGTEPHGQAWRHIMWAIKLPAKRCHNYDTATITGRRHGSLCHEIFE